MRSVRASPKDYCRYREELEGDLLVRADRHGALIVAALNTGFIPVDYLIFPGQFWWLLGLRVVCNAAMLTIFRWTARSHPLASAISGVLLVGGMLLEVIRLAGGLTSDYAPGLMLLFLGMPVLLPFSARQASGVIAVLFVWFAGLPLISGELLSAQSYLLHLVFPLAAGIESAIATALLDGMRFEDFRRREEVEKARDDLKVLDREKSRFTANIHHELRTPLTLTLAPVEAMLSGEFGEVSELQRGYLKTVHSNGLRLLKLINNLLDLAKIEGQQLRISRRPLRVAAVVEDIVTGARPLAERKGVRVEMQGLEGLPEICADGDALEKVVVNLLGNALKFTDRGGSITLSGTTLEDGGVELVVSDTGLGIPPEQLDRIFDRFAQVDGSSTRKHEGTGIGLALVQELVGLHGGRIWAESEGVGHGTAMHVVLPAGESDADDETIEEALDGDDGSAARLAKSIDAMGAELDLDEASYGDGLRLAELSRNVERNEATGLGPEADAPPASALPPDAAEVLIVEDNADMRRLLTFLVGQEFRLRVARNGREGLERVRERKPDLVLTDVMMPEMSGTELCAAIKADEATAGIPVVLVTSKAEREMKIQGLELGADDYVTKPFHPRELLARVRSLVKLRRVQAELAVQNARLESTNIELQSTMAELREAGSQLVQAERLAAVGELAAGVAHEVNNPVNYALNAAKTLLTYVEDVREVAAKVAEIDAGRPEKLEAQIRALEELRERLRFDESAEALAELARIVSEGLDRTSRLVGDLRDFAAPGDQRRADIDLARGLRTTLQLVGHTLAQREIETEFDVPDDLPGVEGDARALNQVFLNLLKNAAEVFEGRGRIAVRARPEGDSIVVEIRDDGPGVAPEVRDQLFDPFVTTKGSGRGSGLGLSISRRIVNEHGGTLELEAAPEGGTVARVRLPMGATASERGPRAT